MSLFVRERRSTDSLAQILERVSPYGPNRSGVNVTADSAMSHSAVWACVRLLASTASTLPLDLVRVSGDVREPLPAPALLRRPSVYVPVSGWVYQSMASLLLRGNAYGWVAQTDARGVPTQVEILHPDSVRVVRQSDRWVWYVERDEVERWPAGPLWHVPGLLDPGCPVGLSPIMFARQTIGAGLAAEQFAAQFFGDGAHPTAVLTTDQALQPDQAVAVKRRFAEVLGGSREPAVLGAGLDYKPIQVSPDESQFLETQRFSVEQVCRVFGVPPEMIGAASSGSSVTYANRTERVQDFLTFSLSPWLARMEEALSGLFPSFATSRTQQVKFNTGALLRADTKARYETYQVALSSGILTLDEVRALEDLPPLEQEHDTND